MNDSSVRCSHQNTVRSAHSTKFTYKHRGSRVLRCSPKRSYKNTLPKHLLFSPNPKPRITKTRLQNTPPKHTHQNTPPKHTFKTHLPKHTKTHQNTPPKHTKTHQNTPPKRTTKSRDTTARRTASPNHVPPPLAAPNHQVTCRHRSPHRITKSRAATARRTAPPNHVRTTRTHLF
jgi:hypothetical protein